MSQLDHLVFCMSQPSLSARDEATLLDALNRAAQAATGPGVSALRLEGKGDGLLALLRQLRDSGARHIRVLPVGFPMAANIMAWLPGAIAHFVVTEGLDLRIELSAPPDIDTAAAALVSLAMSAPARDMAAVRPSLGKPGWQFLPEFDLHLLVCTGPRCAFRGAGTLLAMLNKKLAAEGLADRCLTTTTGCLYPCNQGPMLAIYPQGHWFHIPDEAALDRVVTQVIAGQGDAPELRLAERPNSRRAAYTSNMKKAN